MKWILYLISLLWIALGVTQVLYAEKFQNIFKQLIAEHNPKLSGIPPLLIGALLAISAFWSNGKWFIFSLGLLALLKGTLLLLLPAQKTQVFLKWWFYKASVQLVRLWGLILVILGISIISWI
ncbi:MAG: hypothetical protein ACMUIA_00255 [bacterium]